MTDPGITNEVARQLLDATDRLQWVTDELELKKAILDACGNLGFTRARLYAYDENTQQLVSEASRGLHSDAAELFERGGLVLRRSDDPAAYHWPSLERGEPLVVVSGASPDTSDKPHEDDQGRMIVNVPRDPHAERLEKADISEWLELPLVAEGQIFGKLTLDRGFAGRKIKAEDFYAATILARMFAQLQNRLPKGKSPWENFEDEIAGILRALGAKVRQNVNLAGSQIDVFAEEQTPSGQAVRTAVECKKYRVKVGVDLVRSFLYTLRVLQDKKLADRGMIVTSSGYTQDAQLVATDTDVDLLHIDDLRQKLGDKHPLPPSPEEKQISEIGSQAPKRIFVIMPFGSEYDDLYHLGIRETAESTGLVCERADHIEFNGSIPQQIMQSIHRADIVIAELTQPNPNVYYELGVADMLQKPVVRLTKEPDAIPFDIKHLNHLVYTSITQLRDRLAKRLQSM